MKKKVCIIGGGVIGLCSAYYLNKAGFEVTVIDKSSMNAGASYINAGYIAPSHLVPLSAPGMPMKGLKFMFNSTSPFYLKPRLNADLMRWSWKFLQNSTQKHVDRCAPILKQFNEKSRKLYFEFAEKEGMDFSLTKSGLLMLCQTEKMFHEEKEAAKYAGRHGLKIEVLGKNEISEFEPKITPNVLGAVYYKTDALLIPQDFMFQFRQLLEKNGVAIFDKTDVLKITLGENHSGIVSTFQKEFAFNKLLIAAGSWSSEVLNKIGIKLLMQAGKGYCFEIENPGVKYPAILCEANTAVSPMGKKLRFGGTMEIAGLDETITIKRVKTIKANAEKYYPGIKIMESEIALARQGLRPVSPDGMPYIGKLNQYENVYVATGHSMMGMSLGPATGLLVSQLLLHENPFIDTSLFNPQRFD